MRCSSALGEKRRDGVVHKITSSIASQLTKNGDELTQANIRELFDRVSSLYRSPSPNIAIRGRSPSPVMQRSAEGGSRPISAASVTLPSVSQRQIDQLAIDFSQSLKSRNNRPPLSPTEHNSNKMVAVDASPPIPTSSGHDDMVSASSSKPPRPLPGSLQSLIEEPHFGAHHSPSPTFSPSSFQGSPVLNLSRSASSLRSSTEMMLLKMGDSPIPSTKRLRRVARDVEEYERVVALAAEEKRDKEAKRAQKFKVRDNFCTALDAQCDAKRQLKLSEDEARQQERREVEQQAEDSHAERRRSASAMREKLSKQKDQNEIMRIQTEARRVDEKLELDREVAEEVSIAQTAAAAERTLQLARRECRSNELFTQMKAVEEKKQQSLRCRIDDLRQSKKFQQESDSILAAQEKKRVEQREKALEKIRIGELRSQQQYDRVADKMSDEERKQVWLSKKLLRETADLDKANIVRESNEALRKETSKSFTKECLLRQIQTSNRSKQAEKVSGVEWATQIQRGLETQALLDEMRSNVASDEKREWVHLLDAQSRLKQYQETLDINTSIARGPSPAASLAGSPFRSMSRTSFSMSL